MLENIAGRLRLSGPGHRENHFGIHIFLHLLFVLLGVVFPAALSYSFYRQRKAGGGPGHWSQKMKTQLYYSNGGVLFVLAALVLVGWYVAGRPFTELGLGWGQPPYDLTAVLILFGFVLVYLLDVYLEAGTAERRDRTRQSFRKLGFMPATATQFLNFIFLSVAAGFSEELIYRGFMITYVQELLGDSPGVTLAALLIPAISFGLGHLYQGRKAVAKIILMAILFGFFFIRTGTLWPLMLLHTAIDVFAGLMSWWLLSRR